MSLKSVFALCSVIMVSFVLVGCGQSPKSEPVPARAAADHSHGWWCDEHGVPESVCALCDSKLAARFKAKGDWCKEHDRPESQCFVCNPELEAKFAAQYGKQPPKPEGESEERDQDEPRS